MNGRISSFVTPISYTSHIENNAKGTQTISKRVQERMSFLEELKKLETAIISVHNKGIKKPLFHEKKWELEA